MASSTRQSTKAMQDKLHGQAGVDLKLAEELFAMSNALQTSAQLRSLLSDPSAETAGKDTVIDSVFASATAAAKSLAKQAASLRWSTSRDMAASFELIGVRAVASQSKSLDALQGELFEIQQLVAKDSELELTLSSTRFNSQAKQELIGKLLNGKASADALALARQVVFSRTYKRFAEVIEQYGLWIAEFAGESVAHVKVARQISIEQLNRLSSALAKAFGRELQLNVEVDPEIIGGVHVTVNGEVMDGTVLTKMVNARLQLN
jgi:F-type H+-transporting ATPase subunit delta